ncbi:MAG: hypothetical protein AAGF11_14165 [Myxococcota bacterium]
MWKDLLDRAKRVAEEHLPEDVLEAGRKLGRSVAAHAPAPLAEVINYVADESEQAKAEAEAKAREEARTRADATPERKAPEATDEASATTADAAQSQRDTVLERAKKSAPDPDAKPSQTITAEVEAVGNEPVQSSSAPPSEVKTEVPEQSSQIGPLREDPRAVLERVKTKAERGLKPEDRLVVIYATPDEQEDVAAIETILEKVEAEVRHNDLRREPQTARQLAKLTGVMVPPYVFINGRHWGNRYDLESLAASGDLPLVVANRLDEISDEARRIGHLQQSFSDEISVQNILARWRQGHILCVDDLDAWFESDRDGERFYYQGGPRPVEDMPAVAAEIVAAVEAEEYEAVWQLEPSVHLP